MPSRASARPTWVGCWRSGALPDVGVWTAQCAGLENRAQRRQDRGDTLAALPQLGVQQTFGGVVDHGDEGEPLLGE